MTEKQFKRITGDAGDEAKVMVTPGDCGTFKMKDGITPG